MRKFQSVDTGKQYFVKPDHNKLEYRQYKVLADIGMAIPDEIIYLKETHELATLDMGDPFYELMREPEGMFRSFLVAAANLINDFHEKISGVTDLDEELIRINPSQSAHPVANFVSRFIDRNSMASNVFLNKPEEVDIGTNSVNRSFNELHAYVMSIIQDYEEKVQDVVSDCYEDTDIILGDFKPENLVVFNDRKLVTIDPLLSRGDFEFDVTKFISRLILEGASPSEALDFLKIYDGNEELDEDVYRGFSRRELINLDMVNILASYMGRALMGKTNYRLIHNLCNQSGIANTWRGALRKS